MLSAKYTHKSNLLRDRYIDEFISYDDYMTSLEMIKDEELNSLSWFSDTRSRPEEIYKFEQHQIAYAKQEIQTRVTQEAQEEQERALIELKRVEQKREEERRKALTPEQKLFEERENYYKSEVPQLIEEYRREAKKYKSIHDRVQALIIIGSAIVTSITGMTIFTSTPWISLSLKIIAAM